MENKITADESLRSKLNGASVPVEIGDKDGKVLGHFLPEEVYQRLIYEVAKYPPDLTPEELDRRFAEGPGKPLSQIWKELGSEGERHR